MYHRTPLFPVMDNARHCSESGAELNEISRSIKSCRQMTESARARERERFVESQRSGGPLAFFVSNYFPSLFGIGGEGRGRE